jgi:hypothetical protein
MSYSPTVPGRMTAIKPWRGFAFAVLAAAPASVDEAVAEAAVLAAGLLRLRTDLSPGCCLVVHGWSASLREGCRTDSGGVHSLLPQVKAEKRT